MGRWKCDKCGAVTTGNCRRMPVCCRCGRRDGLVLLDCEVRAIGKFRFARPVVLGSCGRK